MPYIAFASAKGSPGVTTAIAALTVSWPEDRSLYVAELDPAGGDLAVRFDLAPEPGLVTLAAAGRRGVDRAALAEHAQTLALPTAEGAATRERRILVGPVGAEQAVAALTALRGGLHRALSALEGDVLVDCGRLDPGSAAEEIADHADLLIVVARPVVAEVHHLATRLRTLRPKGLSLLLIGERPYSVAEVASTVGAAPLAGFAVDHRAALTLAAGVPSGSGALRRSRLLRSARSLAEALAGWLGPGPGATAAARPEGGSSDGHSPARQLPPPPSGPPPGPAPVPPPVPPPPPPGPPVSTASGAPGNDGHGSVPAPTYPAAPPVVPSVPFPPLPEPPLARPGSGGTGEAQQPRHFRRDSEGSRR